MLGRLILELRVPREARRCLEYITPSGVEEKLTTEQGKDVSQGGRTGDQAFCQPFVLLIRLHGASETGTPRFQTQPHHLLALSKSYQL